MDEKMSILKMIETGKITAEEGAELLKALEEKPIHSDFSNKSEHDGFEGETASENGNIKFLKIRIHDTKNNKTKVNVNIPYGLVKFGLKFISNEDLNDKINLDEILKAAKNCERGKIIDVYDDEERQHIEIYLE